MCFVRPKWSGFRRNPIARIQTTFDRGPAGIIRIRTSGIDLGTLIYSKYLEFHHLMMMINQKVLFLFHVMAFYDMENRQSIPPDHQNFRNFDDVGCDFTFSPIFIEGDRFFNERND